MKSPLSCLLACALNLVLESMKSTNKDVTIKCEYIICMQVKVGVCILLQQSITKIKHGCLDIVFNFYF